VSSKDSGAKAIATIAIRWPVDIGLGRVLSGLFTRKQFIGGEDSDSQGPPQGRFFSSAGIYRRIAFGTRKKGRQPCKDGTRTQKQKRE